MDVSSLRDEPSQVCNRSSTDTGPSKSDEVLFSINRNTAALDSSDCKNRREDHRGGEFSPLLSGFVNDCLPFFQL